MGLQVKVEKQERRKQKKMNMLLESKSEGRQREERKEEGCERTLKSKWKVIKKLVQKYHKEKIHVRDKKEGEGNRGEENETKKVPSS